MKWYLRFSLRLFLILFAGYSLLLILVYFNQENLLFHPESRSSKSDYTYSVPHTEKTIHVGKGIYLNGILCRAQQSKGLVFFVHGNAGNLSDVAGPAAFYTGIGYDFFAFDFRGFGKSTGTITSEEQFYSDAQTVYDSMKKLYPEKTIIIAGYSVGTAAATMLASRNFPKQLILMAPYYSMEELASYHYPFVPAFLVSYKFETFRFLKKVSCPVLIGHGRNDGIIPFSSSLKLRQLLKQHGKLVLLHGEGHNGVQGNAVFQKELKKFVFGTE